MGQMGTTGATTATAALYQRFVGPLLSQDEGADAEQLSQITLTALEQASLRRQWPLVQGALAGLAAELSRPDPRLEQSLFGCRFANPVGLAAGFDKNGVAAAIWHLFGFGFAELGTITWHAQPGNPRPRLFRLAAERAALNRMGFNNQGPRPAGGCWSGSGCHLRASDRRCWASTWASRRSRLWSRRPTTTPPPWSCSRPWPTTP